MRLRVEELAARTDVSVDTVRYYQKQALIPSPEREGRVAWYGDEHLELIGRIKDLQRKGFTLAVIRRLLAGELDPTDEALAVALADQQEDEDEEFLTLDELAERSGVPQALIESVAAEELLVARIHEGEERYTTGDVEVLQAGLRLLGQGLPLPDLLAFAKQHHEVTRQTAEAAVQMFDAHVREPIRQLDLPPEERAERLADAFRELLPAATTLVSHHFRRVLLQVAQEHLESVGEPEEIAAANEEARRRLEVISSQ